MGEVVAVLVLLAVLLMVGVVGTCWFGWRRLRRRNEVCAARPLRPPMRWLVSPGTSARLHRRLRDAVGVMRLAVPARRPRRPRGRRQVELSPLDVLAAEIEAHAIALDGELLIATRRRGPAGAADRQQALRRVDQLERSALRVAAEARRCTRHSSESVEDALRRIDDDLDARAAAWAEVSRIEREAGLRSTA